MGRTPFTRWVSMTAWGRRRKVYVKDVKQAMKGRVRDGYTFNPECKISKEDRYYNAAPTANDKVHVLVCVVDANTVSQMSPKAIETLQDIREEASDLNIPQVAILTKIDLICPEIKKDVKNVYRSKILKQKLQQGTPNFPFPGHINQLRLGDPEAFPGQVRDIIPPPSPGSPRGLLPAGRPST
ncbi:interferon-induced protein 44-like isoform X1 [Sander vitreus]